MLRSIFQSGVTISIFSGFFKESAWVDDDNEIEIDREVRRLVCGRTDCLNAISIATGG